jgi:hypothetical protein
MSGIDINIDDILIDPSLEEAMDEMESKRAEAEAKANEPQPTISVDDVIKAPTINVRDEVARMLEQRNTPEIQFKTPVVSEPIENNADSLLEGSIDPEQIIQQLIVDPIKNDGLCGVINRDDSTNSIMNYVMKEIAEELAYLKAYRKVHYLANEDVSEVSLKRIKSLKTLVETIVEREKLKSNDFGGKIDFYSESFERVIEFILNTVKNAFDKVGIPDQFNDIFFTQLAQDLEGFEKKIEKVYYGTNKKSK